jgi:hypothetical protein
MLISTSYHMNVDVLKGNLVSHNNGNDELSVLLLKKKIKFVFIFYPFCLLRTWTD